MDWLAFAGSIIGGLISGLFTFIGVKLTIGYDNKKKSEEELRKAIEDRPRLELVSFKDINDLKEDKKIDLCALHIVIKKINTNEFGTRFFYDKSSTNFNNLVSIEYTFRNVGKTEIDLVTLCTNFTKSTSLFDLERSNSYIAENMLNYKVDSSKRFIKSNDTITIRIFYNKNEVISGTLSAPISIYMLDIYGKYWEQPLFAPDKETDNSRLVSSREFRDNYDINTAEKCFRGELYW